MMTAEPTDSPAEDHIAALTDDTALGPVVREHGPVTIEPADDLFERLVTSLVRQQVSMDAADAIEGRLFDRFEVTPSGILTADAAELHDAGLSEAKVEYAKATARAFQKREWDHDYFAGMADDAVADEVTEIRGVGPWTAKMFLMFGLGREDVFPVEDLGIRKGMETVFDDELTRAEMRERATEWAPYRSYASLYLWRAVEG
jgi:DNA-3-methyladenine glycosylase II